MNEFSGKNETESVETDDVGQLIKSVGGRTPVDPERARRAHDNVLAHWEQVVAEHGSAQRAGRFRTLAIAASMVLVMGLAAILLDSRGPMSPQELATVERLIGTVRANDRVLGAGSGIIGGARLQTGPEARIALRLGSGQSLRVDTQSSLVLHAQDHVSLLSGAVYIDSDDAAPDVSIRVQTPLGTARDIGTRFQVRLTPDALQVGVRDGLVEVGREGMDTQAVDTGFMVTLGPDGGTETRALASDDPEWNWVEEVVPAFEIQGATLAQYLQWYAREQGLQLAWSDAESEANARATILSGSIDGAALEESLWLVERIAPFSHVVDGGTLQVTVE